MTTPLFKEEFLLAVANDNPLAKQNSIKKDKLDHQKLLLLDDGHCMNNQLVTYCNYAENSNNKTFRATSLEVLRHMVASGAGMTLMPKLSTEKCHLATYIPFSSPKPMREIGLVYKKSTSRKKMLLEMCNQIKKLSSSFVDV